MPRARLLAVATLLALASCGGTAAPGDGRAATPTPGTTREDGARDGGRLASPIGTGGRAVPRAIPSPTGTPGPRGSRGDIPLSVSLDKYCVAPGGSMTATAVTLPSADVTFAAFYPGEAFRDFDYHYVPPEANPTGTYSWTWVVKPTVPSGTGQLHAVAGKGAKGASAYALFEIRSTC